MTRNDIAARKAGGFHPPPKPTNQPAPKTRKICFLIIFVFGLFHPGVVRRRRKFPFAAKVANAKKIRWRRKGTPLRRRTEIRLMKVVKESF